MVVFLSFHVVTRGRGGGQAEVMIGSGFNKTTKQIFLGHNIFLAAFVDCLFNIQSESEVD